jgi:hypothetical protein
VTWFNVWVDGAAHGCELPADAPPVVGQIRDLGGVVARIDDVLEGTDGKPLILASRVTRQPRAAAPPAFGQDATSGS